MNEDVAQQSDELATLHNAALEESVAPHAGMVTNGMYYDGTPIQAVLDNAPELHITIPPATLETSVCFSNPENGETLAGIVRMPLDFERVGWDEPAKQYPALVFNGPSGPIKEQTQSTYAK